MVDGSSYSIFADESSLGDRYLGFGAILLPSANLASAEQVLEEYCVRRGFQDREMSWKKCSASKADRYREFIALFWELVSETPPIDFRAMVLDQREYPLKAPEWGCPTAEDGFYKFYYQFLTRSATIVAPTASHFDVHVALTPDRYEYRSEILTKTMGGALGRTRGRGWQVAEVVREQPKAYRIHQLADVLVGAVTHRLNERRTGPHKEELAKSSNLGSVGRSISTGDHMSGHSTIGSLPVAASTGGPKERADTCRLAMLRRRINANHHPGA